MDLGHPFVAPPHPHGDVGSTTQTLVSLSVSAAHYQPPPVTKRGYGWRITVAALASLGLLIAAASTTSRPHVIIVLDWIAGLVSWVIVFRRRRWPTAIAMTCGVLSSLSILSAGPALWTLFSLATTRRWPRYIAAAAVTAAAGLAYMPVDDPGFFRAWPYNGIAGIAAVGGFALIAAWGGQVGAKRELLETLRDRAERAEAERDLRAAQARSLERERIAREMHDVLAHRISQISTHAGALAFRTDLPAEQLAESAQTIRQSARRALMELRDVLGVLRTGGRETDADGGRINARLPVPTAGSLPELVGCNRAAGMAVRADLDEDLIAVLPDRIGRTVYRVVQEGLTNATRHATGSVVHLTLKQRDEQVEVSVRNYPSADSALTAVSAAPLPESGFGLTGLQERIDMLGGTLHAGPDADGYLLCARLPWTGGHGTDSDPDRR